MHVSARCQQIAIQIVDVTAAKADVWANGSTVQFLDSSKSLDTKTCAGLVGAAAFMPGMLVVMTIYISLCVMLPIDLLVTLASAVVTSAVAVLFLALVVEGWTL